VQQLSALSGLIEFSYGFTSMPEADDVAAAIAGQFKQLTGERQGQRKGCVHCTVFMQQQCYSTPIRRVTPRMCGGTAATVLYLQLHASLSAVRNQQTCCRSTGLCGIGDTTSTATATSTWDSSCCCNLHYICCSLATSMNIYMSAAAAACCCCST
jgi:hypothetical protein